MSHEGPRLLEVIVNWIGRHRKLVPLPGGGTVLAWVLVGSDSIVYVSLVLAALWAVAVACIENVCIRYRWTHTDHPQNPRLWRPLRGERTLLWVFWFAAAVQILIASAPFVIPWPTTAAFHISLFVLLVLAAIVQAIPLVFQPMVQTKIKEIVGDNTRTRRFAETPFWDDDNLGQALAKTGSDRFFLHRWLAVLFASRVGVSLYVLSIWFSVAGIFAIDASAVVRDMARPPHVRIQQATNTAPAPKPPNRPKPSKSPKLSTPPGGGEGGGGLSSTSPTSVATWESECGPLPGFDAPEWARTFFVELYLGKNTGPGARAGCTGATQYVPGSDGFAYLIGYEDGVVRSVAVVSKDTAAYPPALFMAPAAELVLDLIHRDGVVGGTGRLDAASGDLYLAYGRRGTTALTRTTKNGAYSAVPPAVVDEWFADMTVRNQWLWPVQESNDPTTGYERFRFDQPDGRKTGLVIEYDPAADVALIVTTAGAVSHSAGGRRVSAAQLEGLGAKVDPMLAGIKLPNAASVVGSSAIGADVSTTG